MAIATNDVQIQFNNDYIIVHADGKRVEVQLDSLSKKLANANNIERSNYIVSNNNSIYWPQVNETISIDQLIKNFG